MSPSGLSHDAISHWLSEKNFRPRELWALTQDQIQTAEPCLLIADDTVFAKPRSRKVEGIINAHWSIEVYHREIKQTCGIERCQARRPSAKKSYIFSHGSLV